MADQPPTRTEAQSGAEMPDLKDVIHDLAHNRAHYIDRYIERRSRHREFDVSDDQLDTWTAEAVAQWRELYPALQALWEYEVATRVEVFP